MSEPLVLVVTDDADRARVLVLRLGHGGYANVLVCRTPHEALRAVRQRRPGVVLYDVHHAEMDGFRFCRLLRSSEYASCPPPPVVLFSTTGRDSRAFGLAREAGAFALVEEPCEESELFGLLRRALGASSVAASPDPVLDETRARVLVVDHDSATARRKKDSLVRRGFEVEIAPDAIAAQNALAETKYDLVLVSDDLPVVGGVELLAWIRKSLPSTPVVVTAASDERGRTGVFLRAGADDFLPKETSPEEIESVCRRALTKHELMEASARVESSEQRLRASEDRYRSLFEHAPDAILLCDRSGVVVEANPAAELLTGLSREELRGCRLDRFYASAEELEARRRAIRERGYVQDFEVVLRRADGRLLHALETGCLVRDAAGEPLDYQVVFRDVTERKRGELELAEANRQFQQLGRIAATILSDEPGETVFRRVCAALAEVSGYRRAALYFRDGEAGRWLCAADVDRSGGAASEPASYEEILRRGVRVGDSSYFLTAARGSGPGAGPPAALAEGDELVVLVREADGEPCGMLRLGAPAEGPPPTVRSVRPFEIFGRLVAAYRKRLELERRIDEQRRFLTSLVESSADGILACDGAMRVTLTNPAAEAILGARGGDLVGRSLAELVGEEVAGRLVAAAEETAGPRATEIDVARREGDEERRLSVVASRLAVGGERAGLLLLLRDVTAERRLQRQLAEAQKIESIGALAGGLAHDFNNILAAILPNAELLASAAPAGSATARRAAAIEAAARRGGELTQRLLAFARPRPSSHGPIDANASVEATVGLLRETLDPKIRIETSLDEALPSVAVDPGQLEHVLLNLALNARDALMPTGGTLRFETKALAGEEPALEGRGLEAGTYVAIAVEDTGTGMRPEIAEKIFEPFFTTKPPGKGTGLGLSTAYGIVKAAGGRIDVRTRPGAGSRFTILLPAVARPATAPPADPGPVHGRGERILVVDDEASVRELVAEMLGALGYRVTAVATGDEAVEVCRGNEPPDLVVLDLIMPEPDGLDTYRRLKAVRPALAFLLTSGDPQDPRAESLQTEGVEFLEKPFGWTRLSQKVRRALDADSAREEAVPASRAVGGR